jgi:hypothetical protein
LCLQNKEKIRNMHHCMIFRKTIVLLMFTHVQLQTANGNHMDSHQLQDRAHEAFQSNNHLSGEHQFEHANFGRPSADSETQTTQSFFGTEKMMACSPGLDCVAMAAQQRRAPASSAYAALAFLSVLAAGTAVRSLLAVRSRIPIKQPAARRSCTMDASSPDGVKQRVVRALHN